MIFRWPLAAHDSNPYPNRSRIARYNATKIHSDTPPFGRPVEPELLVEEDRHPRCHGSIHDMRVDECHVYLGACLRGRTPKTLHLWLSARLSAVLSGCLRPEDALFSGGRGESARISGSVCVLGAVCHIRSVPLSAA